MWKHNLVPGAAHLPRTLLPKLPQCNVLPVSIIILIVIIIIIIMNHLNHRAAAGSVLGTGCPCSRQRVPVQEMVCAMERSQHEQMRLESWEKAGAGSSA